MEKIESIITTTSLLVQYKIASNMRPPSDIQVCLEAQLVGGTNKSPGNWSECKPVIEDRFYVAKIDFTGLDHSKLSRYTG